MHCSFLDCASMHFVLFLLWGGIFNGFNFVSGDQDLRILLQNPQNQNVIRQLGTRFEVVHPVQVGQEWGRRLSTRESSINGSVTHLQKTSLLIETYEYKLHLDLELSSNLFPSTLIQFIYEGDGMPSAINELPENCYYHANIRNFSRASAAFSTCDGIKGLIFLENKMFLLHPLRGNFSENAPHLLYHLSSENLRNCASTDSVKRKVENIVLPFKEGNVIQRKKFVELALVIDQTLYESYKLHPKEITTSLIEMVNYADLVFRPLDTSLSIIYVEMWKEDQFEMDFDIFKSLKKFEEYSDRRIKRISIDAAHLLSGRNFIANKNGAANLDTICTPSAVGLTSVDKVFQPHTSALILAHLIGHNFGITHDVANCKCTSSTECIMASNVGSPVFSNCSINEFYNTLSQGHGSCLFNMPSMRKSICGNSILEESEECDCGPAEDCMKHEPCCDPATCKLITHAECSLGACCRKCKLLSPDYMCRLSIGECDVPEFCDGENGECPQDLHKKNGAICSEGLGYCFNGFCPLLKSQCKEIWGEEANGANSACFERLNILGTPNGNCGLDTRGEIRKCASEDSHCGSLQCSGGEKVPISKEILPIDFVIYRMNAFGAIDECKARTFSSEDLNHSLVKDGTKCGYQKLCLNQTCTSIKSIALGKCPLEELQATCSGHGVCTSINTCYCHEGWKGDDCSQMDEENSHLSTKTDGDYYGLEESMLEKSPGESGLDLNPNLAVTALVTSTILALVLVVMFFIFLIYRNVKIVRK